MALGLKANLPIGDKNDLVSGSDTVFVETGFSHGMESLHFYYFVDVRFRQYFGEGSKPANRLHLDISPGWRPVLGEIEDPDLVFFLEANYIHFFKGQIGSFFGEQDIVYITLDILLSPSNRLMFRFGIQIPVWKKNSSLGPDGANVKFGTEIRF